MLNLTFGVARQNIELLHKIVEEASDYGIWSVFYGEEEIKAVESVRNKVNAILAESQQSDYQGFPLMLSFKEGQVLKKIIIFYLTNNNNTLQREEFETISDFILFVDDSLAFELEEMGI